MSFVVDLCWSLVVVCCWLLFVLGGCLFLVVVCQACVNQALRIKIAYWSKEEEKENTRDRSVPDGSNKNTLTKFWKLMSKIHKKKPTSEKITSTTFDVEDEDNQKNILLTP